MSTFVHVHGYVRANQRCRAVTVFYLNNGGIINIFTWLLVCSFKKPN